MLGGLLTLNAWKLLSKSSICQQIESLNQINSLDFVLEYVHNAAYIFEIEIKKFYHFMRVLIAS